MNDGVMDDIFCIPGTRMPWLNTWLGPEKRNKSTHLIYVLYILYEIYIVYIYMNIIYLIYCIYMWSQK